MENIVELPGIHHGADAGSLPQSGAEGCKKKKESRSPGRERPVISFRKGESAYSAFLITAQAILAGEPEDPGAATA